MPSETARMTETVEIHSVTQSQSPPLKITSFSRDDDDGMCTLLSVMLIFLVTFSVSETQLTVPLLLFSHALLYH